jgi:glucosamine-phosphate N-acetyltransferase
MDLEKLEVRNLVEEDYYKGFLQLINYFTKKENTKYKSFFEFQTQFKNMIYKNSFVYVIEYENKIIGSATLYLQLKFHNDFEKAGLIEEVIINEKFRGKGLGKKLINYIINEAKKNNCYKIVLNAEQKNAEFYSKLGFINKGIEFKMYL